MTARKMQLLMSKYGFSITIMLAELFIIFGLFLYLGRMAPILWIILVILMSMATIVSIVNRSMNPESKVNMALSSLCSSIWSLALYHVWRTPSI